MKTIKIIGLFIMLLNVGMVNAQKWKISNDYSISFANKDVSGLFKEMSGSIVFDAADLANSKFNLKIQVESISTGNGIQNKHAISNEWFGASKFPDITFVSDKVEKTENGYKAVGKLEMKGVTKTVTIPFTFGKKGNKATFVGKFSVDRTDFGVGEKGNDVAETIKITATIHATKN
jgi:polyisoprenoid-binding protein YceI